MLVTQKMVGYSEGAHFQWAHWLTPTTAVTKQSTQAQTSGIYAEGDQSPVFDALEDDELLVGRERDDEDGR